MKKLHQLLLIEAGDSVAPLPNNYLQLLQTIAETPVVPAYMSGATGCGAWAAPDLMVLHGNLATAADLQRFIALQTSCPFSPVLVVSDTLNEEVALQAIEASAIDALSIRQLTPAYLRKTVVMLTRQHNTTNLQRNREQLLACLQNMPNVAVQWYNGKGKILLWNAASEQVFGFSAAEAMGSSIDDLFVVPGSEHFWLHKLEHLAKTKSTYGPQEWAFHHRDGRQHWCISTLITIPSFDSEPWFACMDVDITDRKLAETAVQEKEQRYYTLFNQASDAVFINDDDGRFLEMNERAFDLTGYTKEQLLTMKVSDMYSKEELRQRPIMRQQLLRGERTAMERNLLRADGSFIPVEVTAQRFADGRTMAILRDISDRRKAEEALRRSEEKYRLLVAQQADAITIFNDEGCVLEANQSATELLQYTEEEFKRMYFPDILLKEDLTTNPIDFTTLKTGVPTIKQRRMRRKDGGVVDTEVHAKQLWDGLFLASVRDITERLEVQHHLEREITLSNSIINSLPGVFFLFTKEGKHLRWNRRKEEITGWTQEEILKMHTLEFIAKSDRAMVMATIAEAFAKGSADTEALLLTKSGKEIPYFFSIVSLIYKGEECILGTGLDLSELRALQKQLADEKLAQQKKLMQAMLEAEEKERNKLGLELHDNVNQILSVVRLYLSMLSSGEQVMDVTLPKTIELLNTAIHEIRNLSHSLAVTYRFEEGLSEALTDMVEKVQVAKDFTIRLQAPKEVDCYTTAAQKLALYRVVQEQLSNIIKYAKATAVHIQLNCADARVILTITDDGVGFDTQRRSRGLGLTNITNRAEALNGEVNIQSAPGKGCRLTVTLPLLQMEKAK